MKNVIAWVMQHMGMSLESITTLEADGVRSQKIGYGEDKITSYRVTVRGTPMPGAVRSAAGMEFISVGYGGTKVILVKTFDAYSPEYISLLKAINEDNLS